MESRAKLLGHAIHPMLIVFPLGLLATSFVFDVIYKLYGDVSLASASFWCLAAGLIGGLVAAVFGFWDWVAIPTGTRAKRVGMAHGAANALALLLFGISWLLRWYDLVHAPSQVAIILSFLGVAIASVGGWLGGELVEQLGVGVNRGAHLDAPSSLSRRPAAETHPPREHARDTHRRAA